MYDLNSHLLVIDLEATCWRGHPPPGEQREIIEIGLCPFDVQRCQPGQARSILVKPQRSKISEFCTHLTSITPEMADAGIRFDEACDLLRREYHARDVVWISWGKDDRRLFEQQCASFGVDYPLSARHYDLRRLFALAQRSDRSIKARQVGLLKALDLMGVASVGTAHRGVDDAYNTARLLAAMFEQYGRNVLNL